MDGEASSSPSSPRHWRGAPSAALCARLGGRGQRDELRDRLPDDRARRGAGTEARPFYTLAAAQGFAPDWNFHKILLDREGRMVAHFDRFTAPELVETIEALLPQGC